MLLLLPLPLREAHTLRATFPLPSPYLCTQTLYNVLELGTYEPYNNKDLGNVSWGMDERLELLKTFSLRPDTLAMHGRERVSYFYGDGPTGLRKLVSDGWWKEDVKQFGEY